MAGKIVSGNTHYGEIGQNIKDPIFIQQPDDHSCALRSQQIVLRDFGIDIPFNDLERIAKEKRKCYIFGVRCIKAWRKRSCCSVLHSF